MRMFIMASVLAFFTTSALADTQAQKLYGEITEYCQNIESTNVTGALRSLIRLTNRWPGYLLESAAGAGSPESRPRIDPVIGCLPRFIVDAPDERKAEVADTVELWLGSMRRHPAMSEMTARSALQAEFGCAALAASESLQPDLEHVRAKLNAYLDSLARLDSRFQPWVEIGRSHRQYADLLTQFDINAANSYLRAVLSGNLHPYVATRMRGLLNRNELYRIPMDIAVEALDGRTVDLRQLRGKVVLINFRGMTWCYGCMLEQSYLKSAYARYRDQGFEILTIVLENRLGIRPEVERRISEWGLTWPHHYDDQKLFVDNPYVEKYGLGGVPQNFLLDQTGRLVSPPGLHGKEIDSWVAKLLTGDSGGQK